MYTNKKISESFWLDNLTGNRYKTREDIPTYIDESRLEHWDSALEHSCYYHLHRLAKGRELIRQSEKIILPKDKLFKQLSWKIDFEITGDNGYLIECKGNWITRNQEALSNFLKLLRLFKMFYPIDFSRLIVVSDKKFKLGLSKVPVYSFDELPELIK